MWPWYAADVLLHFLCIPFCDSVFHTTLDTFLVCLTMYVYILWYHLNVFINDNSNIIQNRLLQNDSPEAGFSQIHLINKRSSKSFISATEIHKRPSFLKLQPEYCIFYCTVFCIVTFLNCISSVIFDVLFYFFMGCNYLYFCSIIGSITK